MRHHSIICRLGETDDQDLALLEPGSVITDIQFLDGYGRLQYGIGQAIEQLADLGLSPGETAVDLDDCWQRPLPQRTPESHETLNQRTPGRERSTSTSLSQIRHYGQQRPTCWPRH